MGKGGGQDGYTAVHRAAMNGRSDLLQDLLATADLPTLLLPDKVLTPFCNA